MKKITYFSMANKKPSHSVLLLALCSSLFAVNAHAATASATFNVVLGVNAPVCTVSTNNATVALPTAGSPNQTIANYLSANGITTASQLNASYSTSAALNQLATITCTTASTPISSFVVQPAAGSSFTVGTGIANLLDTGTVKAGGGSIYVGYEQISVNGTAAAQSYTNTSGTPTPYTTTFTTAALANGTATVAWRPFVYNGGGTTAIGTPAGGSFSSPGQIIINY